MNNKILEVNNITKYYGKTRVLKNVSFSLNEGEIIGFVGPNGAGKSTTMKAIAGLIRLNEGEVIINGHSVEKEREQALANISIQIENPAFYHEMSGEENIKVASLIKGAKPSKAKEVIEFMNIGNNIKKKATHYSLGMKQRLALAIALLNEPKIIVLDEPTNGLDYDGVINLRKTILRLAKEKNIAFLISSHNLSEVEKISDRIVWINHGELLNPDSRDISINYIIKTDNEINDESILKYCIKKDDTSYVFLERELMINDFLNMIIANGIVIKSIEKTSESLEEEYINVMVKPND